MYRIADPGDGFDIDQLAHAAISNPADDPLEHARVREAQGLRPGGLGLLMSKALVDEVHLQREAQRGRAREVSRLKAGRC